MGLIPWRDKRRDESTHEAAPMSELRAEIDRLFESFVREPFQRADRSLGQWLGWSPPVEITSDDEAYTVRVELPGLEPDDIHITVTGNTLNVSGEKKAESKREAEGYYYSETHHGSFRRSIELPGPIDPDKVSAESHNGVLSVRLQRTPGTQPKHVEVKKTQPPTS